jgi:glycine dehydrogenase subunit 2
MNPKAPGSSGLVLSEPLLFELPRDGNSGIDLPEMDVDWATESESLPAEMIRQEVEGFPELSEPDVVRHFSRLSTWNFSVDSGFYPLGSCTMKYNPKLNEAAAAMKGFSGAHPYLPEADAQGILQLLWELQHDLAEISGMDSVCLHPAAGSHGELLGMMLIRAYHMDRGDHQRTKIIIPDSAHGTNPSSAATCGFQSITLPSGKNGQIDLDALDRLVDDQVAGIMITNPNTCGLFESNIDAICQLMHDRGGLIYMDGANMNALVGKVKPGDMGIDVLHFNTHKTFSTPHGGGGPGAGPIALKKELEPFLPKPALRKTEDGFHWDYDIPRSIGQIRSFFGNIGVLIRAYTFIKTLGNTGLREMSETAVVNANYLKKKLEDHFFVPFVDQYCMHEVLISDENLLTDHISTMDMAKGLIDAGFHPPTVYFPLIVKGAMLIEPTETESRLTLDQFVSAMLDLKKRDSSEFQKYPINSYVGRVDEVTAARKPVLKWESPASEED